MTNLLVKITGSDFGVTAKRSANKTEKAVLFGATVRVTIRPPIFGPVGIHTSPSLCFGAGKHLISLISVRSAADSFEWLGPAIEEADDRHEAQPEASAQEVLAGLVERVTYHNVENRFCVLRAKVRGDRDVVTVVGHAAAIAAGEWITASGDWMNDRIHGQQFKARFLRTSLPDSADGIEKYLSSGMARHKPAVMWSWPVFVIGFDLRTPLDPTRLIREPC